MVSSLEATDIIPGHAFLEVTSGLALGLSAAHSSDPVPAADLNDSIIPPFLDTEIAAILAHGGVARASFSNRPLYEIREGDVIFRGPRGVEEGSGRVLLNPEVRQARLLPPRRRNQPQRFYPPAQGASWSSNRPSNSRAATPAPAGFSQGHPQNPITLEDGSPPKHSGPAPKRRKIAGQQGIPVAQLPAAVAKPVSSPSQLQLPEAQAQQASPAQVAATATRRSTHSSYAQPVAQARTSVSVHNTFGDTLATSANALAPGASGLDPEVEAWWRKMLLKAPPQLLPPSWRRTSIPVAPLPPAVAATPPPVAASPVAARQLPPQESGQPSALATTSPGSDPDNTEGGTQAPVVPEPAVPPGARSPEPDTQGPDEEPRAEHGSI